jgi:hypothetical protein
LAASCVLALQGLLAAVVPLAEPWHHHDGDETAAWHAENDRCEAPDTLAECALLRASQAPAVLGTPVGTVRTAHEIVRSSPNSRSRPSALESRSRTHARAPPAV